jgi:very-short-patch-repair endonuclease
VELDGNAFHRTRRSFEQDRARDAALQVAGCRVVRVTHRRLEREGAKAIGELRSLLAA